MLIRPIVVFAMIGWDYLTNSLDLFIERGPLNSWTIWQKSKRSELFYECLCLLFWQCRWQRGGHSELATQSNWPTNEVNINSDLFSYSYLMVSFRKFNLSNLAPFYKFQFLTEYFWLLEKTNKIWSEIPFQLTLSTFLIKCKFENYFC